MTELHIRKNTTFRARAEVAMARVAIATLADPEQPLHVKMAVRRVAKDQQEKENLAQTVLAVHGEAIDDKALAKALGEAFALLVLPLQNPSGPTLMEKLRVLDHLSKEGRGAETVDAVLAALTPKPEPEEPVEEPLL